MKGDDEYRQHVIETCEEFCEIGPLDDGFQYFWIKDRGAMSATDLRIIADELDRRNKDWQEQIERDLSPQRATPATVAQIEVQGKQVRRKAT